MLKMDTVGEIESYKDSASWQEEEFIGRSEVDEQSLSELKLESDDVLPPLPEGWPKLPQIFRRRSCEFTTVVPVCVQKAKAHLELLQTSIENWFHEKQLEALSRCSSRKGEMGKTPFSAANIQKVQSGLKKELRFMSPGILSNFGSPDQRIKTGAISRLTGASSKLSSTSSGSSDTLSVVGIGSKERPGIVPQGLEADIPYLGAEEVLDETITLLARLEDNRQETQKSLLKEVDKVHTLAQKIDEIAELRLTKIPKAVQSEHDECAADIKELRWHVSYNGRIRDRYKRKANIAQTMNNRLQEDIAFVKKHCPLVEEKLQLEMDAMDKIRKAQLETTQELNHTIDRQENVTTKSTEASQKAEIERNHIKNDLDKVRDELNQISEELSEARMTYNTYIHQLNDCRQQIKDNDQELEILQVKNENAKTSEAMQQKKVYDLEERIKDQEFEHRHLEDDNLKLITKRDKKQEQYDKEIDQIVHQIERKETKLKAVIRRNHEWDIEIEDMNKRLADCVKAKVADEKNIVRIGKEMDRLEEMMKVTMDEFHNVLTINHAIRDQLRSEQERTSHIEESLRNTADTLKKQVKEEIHTRNMITARISTDNTELVQTQTETKTKKEKVGNHVAELEEALVKITDKVEKRRSEYATRSKKIEILTKELSILQGEHQELETLLTGQLGELEPKHKKLTEEDLVYQKKIDHINWKEEMMKDKMKDMTTSNRMLTRVWDSTEKRIRELTDELEEYNIQLEEGHTYDEELKENLQKLTARIRLNETQHVAHMKNREETKDKHQVDLKTDLKMNKELAAKYRQLHNQYLVMKNEFMNQFDERINIESAIKDLKQLHSLQLRLHGALSEYYMYRGAYNESELQRMRVESNGNGLKVSVLQHDMDEALSKISNFLSSQMHSTTTTSKKGKLVPRRKGLATSLTVK